MKWKVLIHEKVLRVGKGSDAIEKAGYWVVGNKDFKEK